MRPFAVWFGRLAMAGVCLAGAGCGGGDVPDPDSDRRAAPSEPSRVVAKGPAAAEAPSTEAPTAVATNGALAEAEKPAPVEKPEPAETEKPAPSLKGDASGTEELLRMAGNPAATPPAGDSPGGSGGGSAPGTPGGSGSGGVIPPSASISAPGAPGGSGSAGPMATIPVPGSREGRPAVPGGPGMPGGGAVGGSGSVGGSGAAGYSGAAALNEGPGFGGVPGAPGMPGGRAGMGGGSGGDSPALQGKNAFRMPNTAVQAFLAALKSKNKDRLAETVAKRAPTEADEKHRKIFSEIIDGSISDDDLDEMAKATGEASRSKCSGMPRARRRIGVVVSKMSGKDQLRRTLMTRQEVEGWKVVDIESMYDFKPGLPPMFMRGGRGRRR